MTRAAYTISDVRRAVNARAHQDMRERAAAYRRIMNRPEEPTDTTEEIPADDEKTVDSLLD